MKEDIKKGYEQIPMYEEKYSEEDWDFDGDGTESTSNHHRRKRRERCDDNTR